MSEPGTGGEKSGARRAVVAALLGNTGVAVSKLLAFLFTGSAAMFAEFLHSVADTGNQVFLLVGLRLGDRPPDEEHPFGYGRERYFWAFIVAVTIFLLGGVFSLWEGIAKIGGEHEIHHPALTYVALVVAAFFETYALRIAWAEFRHWRTRNPGRLWESLNRTKAPAILVVLFEDSAALAGIAVAITGISLSLLTGSTVYDAAASLVIGLILIGAAFFIGLRTRGLLIGEAATPEDRARIREAVGGVPQVVSLIEVLTLHLGPEEILVNLSVEFEDGLDTDALEAAVDEIELRIREAVPAVGRIFIEADSIRGIGGGTGTDS